MTRDSSTTGPTEEKKDTKWTDSQIRWLDDKVPGEEDDTNASDDDEEDEMPFDPFADPDPTEVFRFRFVAKTQKGRKSSAPGTAIEAAGSSDDGTESINLNIHGYKTGSDAVWQSTGLTLWKASTYLCDYMVEHVDELCGERVLEVSMQFIQVLRRAIRCNLVKYRTALQEQMIQIHGCEPRTVHRQ